MTNHQEATENGVMQAFDNWLWDRGETTQVGIEAAAGKAFTHWLENHTDELLAAIASAVARKQSP
ncbi:hypothetical protein [Streptomyces sp. NBC_01264]|uniref:hypothetical protein n=1 Tax=Streptomyces sp. NBC_01264 TaxID=2903804 RepID=UPI00224F2125|nr:hypothetical protein [Streptomyces sp. NBC_01264]MCX4780116.1 hypothetical protein [Streptomyces sp. NBC_01264]